jgi:hypothetical protein
MHKLLEAMNARAIFSPVRKASLEMLSPKKRDAIAITRGPSQGRHQATLASINYCAPEFCPLSSLYRSVMHGKSHQSIL